MSSSNIVKLDIGGTVFKTRKSTLTKFEGFFKTMLETDLNIEKDEFGCIFVDRSPKHFDLILNFMRDGKVVLPNSEQEVEEILNEAEYYLLQGLIEICGGSPSAAEVKTETSKGIHVVQTVPKVRLVQNMDEAEKLRDRTKIFVVITYGNQSPENELPDSNDARWFVQKHWRRCDIFFKPSEHGAHCTIKYEKEVFCGTISFTISEQILSFVESKLGKVK